MLHISHVQTEIVDVVTSGDADIERPLYVMGEVGVFTRQLDEAVLSGDVDIAVHSLKDVPTTLPLGLRLAAVLSRGPIHDLLIAGSADRLQRCLRSDSATIATSSRRRMAQWKSMHPGHEVVALRGNVQTRLKALEHATIDGIILAEAGIQRLGLRPPHVQRLEWMIPAPAQGAIGVITRKEDPAWTELVASCSDPDTERMTSVERLVLARLSAGCTAPIGVLAVIAHGRLHVSSIVLSVDGSSSVSSVSTQHGDESIESFADRIVTNLLAKGAMHLLNEGRSG